MSTILKALRRLEEQKSAASPRPLRDEVVLTPTRRRSHNGVAVALVAALAFAVLGGAAVWLLDRAPATTPASIAEDAPAADVAAPPPNEAAIAAEQAMRTNEVTVAAPDPLAAGAQAPTVPVPATAPDFEIVRPKAQAQRAAVAVVEDAAPLEREEIIVARPSGVAPLPDTEAGFVDEEIPAARITRSRAPVRVERTQWHPDPDRRIAWVEVEGATALREVREGERVGPYLVREIEPAEVSFVDGNAEVRSEVGR